MARVVKTKATKNRMSTKTKSVKDSKSKIKKSKIPASLTIGIDGSIKDKSVTDAFANQWAGIGFGTEALLNKTTYPLTRMSYDYNLFNSLFRDNWVVQNIVSMIPEDMLKNWLKIKCDIEEKELDKFTRVIRKTKLKHKLLQGLKWGRLYGGAIGLILIEGQTEKDLEKPLDLDSIELDSFKGIYILDRWNGVEPSIELIDDINDPDFGEPKYYTISNNDSSLIAKVHNSRIIKFIGRELPYYEKIAEQYWGASEIESVYQEVIKRDNVSNNIANLTFKANIQVYEMENADQLFAIAGSQAQKRFWNMINAQQILESNFSTRVINKGDNYRHEQYTFAGLSDVYESIMMDVSGASHIPVTKLFGRSPAGMNATGESDLQNYYDYITEVREAQLTPIIDKLLPILAMSTLGKIPEDLDFEYNDIRTLTDENKSSIGSQLYGTLLQAYQSGAITQKALLEELAKLSNKFNLFSSIDKKRIGQAQEKTATELQSMQDPMAGLMGGEDVYEEQGEQSEQGEQGQSMGGVDRQNNTKDSSEEDETDEEKAIDVIRENITNMSQSIDSGEEYKKPLIGPSEPIISNTQYETIEPEEIKVDKTPRVIKVINKLIKMIRGSSANDTDSNYT